MKAPRVKLYNFLVDRRYATPLKFAGLTTGSLKSRVHYLRGAKGCRFLVSVSRRVLPLHETTCGPVVRGKPYVTYISSIKVIFAGKSVDREGRTVRWSLNTDRMSKSHSVCSWFT